MDKKPNFKEKFSDKSPKKYQQLKIGQYSCVPGASLESDV